MARLFPTERISVFSHFFQDIAVTDSRDFRLAAHFLQGFMETDITHDRTDDGILFESAFGLQFHGTKEHDLIAVHILALFVDSQAAVGVPVISNADIGTVFQDRFFQTVEVGRTTVFIDVDAVRFIMDGNDFGPQPFEDFRP